MNRVTIMGRLGGDPEIKQLQNGPVANLRIATNESYKDRNGERKTLTEWHKISIYVPFLVDRCKDLKTGDRVYIEGSLRTRSYTNQQNIQQSITEIIVRPYNGTIEIMHPNRAPNNEDRSNPNQTRSSYNDQPTYNEPPSYNNPSNNRPAPVPPHAYKTPSNVRRNQETQNNDIYDDEIPF